MAFRKLGFPDAKKGKPRMGAKSNIMKKRKEGSAYTTTPYVRHGIRPMKSRNDRAKWGHTLHDFLGASDLKIIHMLRRDKWLQDKKGAVCPFCKKGKLSALKKVPGRGLVHKCGSTGCRHYVTPLHGHPVFHQGRGQIMPVQDQAAVCLCELSGMTGVSTHMLLGYNHKSIRRIRKQLRLVRKRYVEKKQRAITFSGKGKWRDVEGDETSFRKSVDPDKNQCVWSQYCGIIERGRPESLVLRQLNPPPTASRAPGPGPIRKVEWGPIAKEYLHGRDVIFHTDKAKSYKLRMPGLLRDAVRHCKKRVKVRGVWKWVKVRGVWKWLKPVYTKLTRHKTPSGRILRTKAGTQVIDRAWRFLKAHLTGVSAKPRSVMLNAHTRSAQWHYWCRGKDLWLEMGKTLA